MDQLSWALIAVLVGMVLYLVYMGINLLMKYTAKNREDFWFFFYGIPRHIKRPNCEYSQYYNRFPKKNSSIYEYASTIDDPFMIELAQALKDKIGNRSDRYKANYILKMVQSGVTYRKDSITYGNSERYAFPVCTSYLHIGDCEDSALLGAGLSKKLGLDTVMVLVNGHLAYAVNVNGFGVKVPYMGKKYLWCESTSIFPAGIYLDKFEIKGIYQVMTPPESYRDDDTYFDLFNKYPL